MRNVRKEHLDVNLSKRWRQGTQAGLAAPTRSRAVGHDAATQQEQQAESSLNQWSFSGPVCRLLLGRLCLQR